MRHPLAHPLLIALTTISSPAGLSNAHAQEAAPCEVCVSRAVVARCAEDATSVDATRARLAACQRQLDAAAGATAELRAQIEALQRAEAKRHAQEVAELERRPRWRAVVIAASVGVVAGAVAWEVAR